MAILVGYHVFHEPILLIRGHVVHRVIENTADSELLSLLSEVYVTQ